MEVLILIVVDNGLVLIVKVSVLLLIKGLNPYCSGQWSRTGKHTEKAQDEALSLNPYCSGQWSRTDWTTSSAIASTHRLNPYCSGRWSRTMTTHYVPCNKYES